jgi:predicted XRE-type DNA-binding protein
MDKKKKDRLAAGGWRTGSAADFLELTPEEAEFVELKLALSSELKELRSEHGISQLELADRLGSSQSRVAKMEASDPTVSVDLLIRGLFAAGASKKDIASAITKAARKPRVQKTARARTKSRSSSTSNK